MEPQTPANGPQSQAEVKERSRPHRERTSRGKTPNQMPSTPETLDISDTEPSKGDAKDLDYVEGEGSMKGVKTRVRSTDHAKGMVITKRDRKIVDAVDLSETQDVNVKNDQLQRQCDELAKKLADTKSKYSKERRVSSNLRTAKADLGKKAEELGEENKVLEFQIAAQETQIIQAQAQLSEAQKRSNHETLPDNIIRQRFAELKSLLRPWCKENAVSSINKLKPQYWQEVVGPSAPNKKEATMSRISEFFDQITSAPSVVLNIALARRVFKVAFSVPFMLVDMLDLPNNVRSSLDKIFDSLARVQASNAHAWRHQTMSSLFHVDHLALHTKAVQSYATNCANDFENFYPQLLKSVTGATEKRRSTELIEIFQKAASLGVQLARQKSAIKLYLKELHKYPFSMKSSLFEPHSLMRCDGDRTEYDGILGDLVVEPCVSAFGNEEGENYDQERVWMKGTILVIPRKRAKDKANANSQSSDSKKRAFEIDIDQVSHEATPKRIKTEVLSNSAQSPQHSFHEGFTPQSHRSTRSKTPQTHPQAGSRKSPARAGTIRRPVVAANSILTNTYKTAGSDPRGFDKPGTTYNTRVQASHGREGASREHDDKDVDLMIVEGGETKIKMPGDGG